MQPLTRLREGLLSRMGQNAVLTDTVGFIRKLPHHLINAFKSTLEEAVNADVLIHVVDVTADDMTDNMEVAEKLFVTAGR